jgi:hypothetical protein
VTSERRAARSAHQGQAVPGSAADADVLALLRDPDAAVWHSQTAYRAFMAARGWDLPVSERLGASASPGNRRNAAADAWGLENDVTTDPGHADWPRLRAMGLIA